MVSMFRAEITLSTLNTHATRPREPSKLNPSSTQAQPMGSFFSSEPAVAGRVEDLIAATAVKGGVVVFSSSSCPYCSQAIAALKSAGIPTTVVNATSSERAELQQRTGKSSVPSAWADGKWVGGCNDGGLGGVLPLLRSGKLQEMAQVKA